MQCRANGVGGGSDRAPDRRVRDPGRDHQRREVQGVRHSLNRLFKRQALGLTTRVEMPSEILAPRICCGISHLDPRGHEGRVLFFHLIFGAQNGDTIRT